MESTCICNIDLGKFARIKKKNGADKNTEVYQTKTLTVKNNCLMFIIPETKLDVEVVNDFTCQQ